MAELDLLSYVDTTSDAISGPHVRGKYWGLGFDAQITPLIPLTILNFGGQIKADGSKSETRSQVFEVSFKGMLSRTGRDYNAPVLIY